MNNDLISREALKKSMRKSINERYISWTKTITVADIATLIFDEIEYAPTVDTTCSNCDSGYAQGYSDGYLKGKEERPQGEWEYGRVADNDLDEIIRCSVCHRFDTAKYIDGRNPYYDYPAFCKRCGASMKKGVWK